MTGRLPGRAKLAFAALAVLYFVCFFSFYLQWKSLRAQEAKLTEHLASQVINLSEEIGSQFFERYGDTRSFAVGVTAVLDQPKRIVNLLNEFVRIYSVYDLILVVDRNGKLIASNSLDRQGRNLSVSSLSLHDFNSDAWFRAVKKGEFTESPAKGLRGVFVGPFQEDVISGLVYSGEVLHGNSFSTPLYDADGDFAGVLSTRANARWVEDLLRLRVATLENLVDVDIGLLSSDGRTLAESSANRTFTQLLLNEPLSKKTVLMGGLVSVFVSSLQGKAATQVMLLPVESKKMTDGLGWQLAMVLKKSAYLESVRQDQELFFLVVTTIGVLMFAGAFYFFRAKKRELLFQEQLVAAKLEAEDAATAKSRFLAHMSHEIRTPLTAIVGMADLLSRTHLSVEQRRFATIFEHASKSLLRIVNDVLDFSKIEAGAMEFEKIPFDLRATLEDAVAVVASLAREKNLQISLLCPDHLFPGEVMGDPYRIQQVLGNLLNNAIKFTEKGEIKVRVAESHAGRSGNVEIIVSDTGVGIAPDKLDLLFREFSQVDSSNRRKVVGSGLGLSICKELVALMGGEIWVESQEGVGSEFHFTIELREASSIASQQVSPSASVGNSVARLRVLLVDDSVDNRILVRTYLEADGHTVLEAENGNQALTVFKREPCDVVLMDMQMSIMSGAEATRAIRSWEGIGGKTMVPIIAFSALTQQVGIDTCLQAGCDFFLSKPVNREELREILALADRIGRDRMVSRVAEPQAPFPETPVL